MNSTPETLPATLDCAWSLITSHTEATASPQPVTLSTVGRSGGGEARQVILRDADRGAAHVLIFTDSLSEKVAEVTCVPSSTILVWDVPSQFQIRLRCKVEILPEEDLRGFWDPVPKHSRRNYGIMPKPATPIDAAHNYHRTAVFGRFTVLRCIIDELETLHLAKDGHQRALFSRSDDWQGQWLVP